MVMVAHGEGARILEKIVQLVQQLNRIDVKSQLLVVLDGIGDRPNVISNDVLEALTDHRVQVVTLPCNWGKAAALSEGVRHAVHDILVFADVRQVWDDEALARLLEGFSDPSVGAVSGDLVLTGSRGGAEGVGLYWKYEKWLRIQESRFDSTIGVTGAICSVRRDLFEAVPPGTILDDVYWPLKVVMKGYRVQHEPRAIAVDRLPASGHDELRRKIRTLCGNYQLLCRLPSAILPWRNRTWWQFISHKLLRLAVPWALIGAVAASAVLPSTAYRWLFFCQVAGYSILVLGMVTGIAYHYRLSSAAAAFLLLNYAAWLAFWVWLLRKERKSWIAVTYDAAPVCEKIAGCTTPSETSRGNTS
jgi:biofilm PGA synthesis N-glycosyltransferase PgaC